MDPKICDESAKDSSNFKCEKILQTVDKSIACPTPQKKNESLPIKSKDSKPQLPEKYRTIADLFSHMICSLRLLNLRNKPPTFQNICSKVAVLAKRNFSYTHLAQMKYILPEGIKIEKVIVLEKKSLCFKPDLKITLVFEVVEDHSEHSDYLALRRYFNSKLTDFFKMHPEGTDIPEATLPELFSERACHLNFKDGPVNLATELSSTFNEIELSMNNLDLSPSFRRHFSQMNVPNQTEQVQCFTSSKNSLSSHESDCLNNQESDSTWQKECTPLSDCVSNLNAERGKLMESSSMCFQTNVINTSVQKISPPHFVSHSSFESPDMKIVSCTDSLMIQTPDIKLQNMTNQKSKSYFKPAKRVLNFSVSEGKDGKDNRVDLLESSKALHEFGGCSEDCKSIDFVSLSKEIQENFGYSFEKTNQNQTDLDASANYPSSLVELVNVIDYVFGSVKRTSITKQELFQKIMMNCLDFDKISEVEEQIEILEKILPDWICKKLISSGDTMYSVKNTMDLYSVRSRLLSNVIKGIE